MLLIIKVNSPDAVIRSHGSDETTALEQLSKWRADEAFDDFIEINLWYVQVLSNIIVII